MPITGRLEPLGRTVRQVERLLASGAVGGPFAVGLLQRIAEPHDAAWIGAMVEPKGVAELVHRLLQSAAAKALLVGAEPEQRDDAGLSARLGNAEDEVQIVCVEVDVGDGEHALSPDRKRQAEQDIGTELAAPRIERPPRQCAPLGQLDIETHAAQVTRQVVEGAAIGISHRQQGDAGHVGHGID